VHFVEEDAGACPESIGIDFHIDEIDRVCERAQNLVGLLPQHPWRSMEIGQSFVPEAVSAWRHCSDQSTICQLICYTLLLL
jgi:hypothetical protein